MRWNKLCIASFLSVMIDRRLFIGMVEHLSMALFGNRGAAGSPWASFVRVALAVCEKDLKRSALLVSRQFSSTYR